MCCPRAALSVLCPSSPAGWLEMVALAERRRARRIACCGFCFQAKLPLCSSMWLKETEISPSGLLFSDQQCKPKAVLQGSEYFCRKRSGEKGLTMASKGTEVGRAERGERERPDSTGKQRQPWFNTFPTSHFVWELSSEYPSLSVPMVCENH